MALPILVVLGSVLVWRFNTSSEVREVVGVVVAIDGDLEKVTSFDVMTPGGVTLRLEPDPGGRFDFPLPHLGAHMRSLDPVAVRYREAEDGSLIAVSIADG
ncbi:MAG: hypothetical protein Q8Q52_00050 [Acidimicrobiia bacterium]|nr:hypothetical protein [Acidimicrobiia bacterium]